MDERNRAKAQSLYAAIDASGFYRNPVAKRLPLVDERAVHAGATRELDAPFLAEAQAAGLMNLEGHRSVGGMRASIYNAMPPEGVEALVDFMQEFERRHG